MPTLLPADPEMSRRLFLRRGAGTAMLLAAAGALPLSCTKPAGRRAPETLRFFDEGEFFVMEAVAEAMLPPREGFPTIQEVDLVERIDAKLAKLPEADTSDIHLLLWIFQYGTPLLGPAVHFFTRMSADGKADYLQGWQVSRLDFKRTGLQALKYLVMTFYYDDERTWKAIEYDGPWVESGWKYGRPVAGPTTETPTEPTTEAPK